MVKRDSLLAAEEDVQFLLETTYKIRVTRSSTEKATPPPSPPTSNPLSNLNNGGGTTHTFGRSKCMENAKQHSYEDGSGGHTPAQ